MHLSSRTISEVLLLLNISLNCGCYRYNTEAGLRKYRRDIVYFKDLVREVSLMDKQLIAVCEEVDNRDDDDDTQRDWLVRSEG